MGDSQSLADMTGMESGAKLLGTPAPPDEATQNPPQDQVPDAVTTANPMQ